MKRSRLRNKFLNTRSDLGRKACNRQRNHVVNLLRKKQGILILTFWPKAGLSEKLLNPF